MSSYKPFVVLCDIKYVFVTEVREHALLRMSIISHEMYYKYKAVNVQYECS